MRQADKLFVMKPQRKL